VVTPLLFMYKVRALALIALSAILARADGQPRSPFRDWGRP
jgi:hypothetical protein